MKKILTAFAVASLMAGQSVAASTAPAPIERASAEMTGGFEAIGEESFLYIILLLAVVAGTAIAMTGDDDKTTPLAPYSP